MPSWSATRRASSTSATEQQPESDAPPHSFRVAPTTRSAAVAVGDAGRRPPTSRHRRTWPPAPAWPSVSQLGDRARHDGQGHGRCRVTGGGGPSEKRMPVAASTASKPMARQARGWPRRRRSNRRRRPNGHAGLVEQDDQRLALHAGEAHVQMAGHPARAGRPVSTAPGTDRQEAVAQPVAASGHPWRSGCRSVDEVAARAAAMPTMPATLWVPLRRSRSWPPPWISGRRRSPWRTTRAPTPFGPPNLWALTATRSAAA